MQDNGFDVKVNDVDNLGIVKQEHQVPMTLQACHTAIVDGYIIEGHVPVEDINRLLSERPDFDGLAVPGMPPGSPGMGSGGGYDVIAFKKSGETELYASH